MAQAVYEYESTNLPPAGSGRNYAVRGDNGNILAVNPGASISTNPVAFFEIGDKGRKRGLCPRHVVLVRVNASTGLQVGSALYIPVLTQAAFDAITEGDGIEVNSVLYNVNRKVEESTK